MDFVIGDIHGEIDKLKALLKWIPLKARLIFIGDYIDKGRDPQAVVDFLIKLKLKRNVIYLLGNHEFKLLEAWQGQAQAQEFMIAYGCQSTLESYLKKKITAAQRVKMVKDGTFKILMRRHLKFFRSLRPFYDTAGYFMVHGGVPLDRLGRFRIGNLEKMVFARRGFLAARKRFRGKVVVFGHTAFKEVFWDGYKLGIDTGAAYPSSQGFGVLTAVDLQNFTCITHQGHSYTPRLMKGRSNA